MGGVEDREDYQYARQIVWGSKEPGVDGDLYGYCKIPEAPRYVS